MARECALNPSNMMSLILSTTSSTEGPRSGAPPTTSAKAAGKRPQYVSALLPFSDALPYYDRDLDNDPSLRARVEREIAKEIARGEASGSGGAGIQSVEERLGPKFEFTKQELDRISRREPPSETLDTTRYTLPAPSGGLSASEDEWDAALRNAAVQVAQQEVRSSNVELLRAYGANAWRLSNFAQEAMVRVLERAEQVVQEETAALNRKRKERQTKIGREGKLGSTERRWTELIGTNLQLEVANLTAAHEVEELKAKRQKLQSELDRLDAQEA